MQLLCSTIGTAAIATIYVIYGAYRDHILTRLNRERSLRERVTYMLWVMANETE